MPQFDGKGPEGKGPNTGRGMGPCNPNKGKAAGRPMAGGAGRGTGKGMGQGMGRGAGRGIGRGAGQRTSRGQRRG